MLGELAQPKNWKTDPVSELEDAVKKITGARFAICMPQARVGIYLALRAAIEPGQRVILSPYTIHDVVNVVICAGGVPIFADIERKTCNPDPQIMKELIDENTGAVLVTHLHGFAMELDELVHACEDNGVPLIEDAAQSFGTSRNGSPVGTFGKVGIYSFGMYKNVSSFYGGMILTNDKPLYTRMKNELQTFPVMEQWRCIAKMFQALATDIATWPPVFSPIVSRIFRYGYLHDIEFLNKRVRIEDNPQKMTDVPEYYLRRMSPLFAKVALKMLNDVQADNKARIHFARMYHDGLHDIAELICPPFLDDGSHTYSYYPIQYRRRDELVAHLMCAGCDLAAQHYKNNAALPCFAEYKRSCPNTAAAATQLILLPTYPRYSEHDVSRNICAIREFFSEKTRK